MKKIRDILKKEKLIIVPGIYDALSAKLVEKNGFNIAYLTSYGISLTLICKPDIGLITLSELVMKAKYIREATKIPIIADGEAGFGNAINIVRLVNNLEDLGINGLDIQDQKLPKTYYLNKGKELTSVEEYVKKIKAALKARKSKEFIVIGRTEAWDLDEAIKRLKAYSKAGVDMVFPHSKFSLSELEEIANEVKMPMVINYPMIKFEGSKPTIFELKNPFFKIVLFPISGLFAAINAYINVLNKIKDEGTDINYDVISSNYIDEITNRDKFDELERLFLPSMKKARMPYFIE
jgi:2-methylisocitrate lyase-like PEP mutase family enzyme